MKEVLKRDLIVMFNGKGDLVFKYQVNGFVVKEYTKSVQELLPYLINEKAMLLDLPQDETINIR